MDLKTTLFFEKLNTKCSVRSIKSSDVNDDYIASLNSNQNALKYVGKSTDYASQTKYIEVISQRRSDCLIGVFYESTLIGTCGAQEVSKGDLTTLGVFLFDSVPKNKGWGSVAVWATCELLKEELQSFRFAAATRVDNRPALGLFANVGFKIIVGNAVSFWLGCLSSSTIKPRGISVNE